MRDWIRRQFIEQQRNELRAMTVSRLRELWDTIGDDSFSDGYDCADIHLVLNEKGDGAYCAV